MSDTIELPLGLPLTPEEATPSAEPAATPEPLRLAWLAGLWDGEGSVGVTVSKSTGSAVYIPTIQINMTHQATLLCALGVLDGMGYSAKLQTIAPRDVLRHRESFYFAIRRTSWLRGISEALMPHAVTKLKQWTLLHEFCTERIARQGLAGATGSLRRGGRVGWAQPYTDREHALVRELRELNATLNNRSATRMGEGAE